MQIKRVNIDPILTVAKLEMPEMRDAAYTPEPIDVSTPDIPEDIGNITHGIEALNAKNEIVSAKKGLYEENGYDTVINFISSQGYYGSMVIPYDSLPNYKPSGDGNFLKHK